MFSDKLYDHKFDIDDIITALCGNNHQGRWLLDSAQKRLIAEDDTSNTQHIEDGDNNAHWHIITPLPNSFIAEIKQHEMMEKLDSTTQKEVLNVLNSIKHMHQLPAFFEQGFAGGWLRERVKEEALEWLDERNMIPPSMRHVRSGDLFGAPPAPPKTKVDII